ncbi:RelA/SpoT domain-containing protein [Aeromicrobium halocynthiae]|uniref:RelA/SpoT domain-containing protein n=1 Tax=Aeromicrobium halocynthiae TaxID=560557 RepID=UPI0031D2C8F6
MEISQRLKRWPTILDKLEREPTLDLSRMQDIGGCRAILDSIDDIRRVEARVRKNRSIVGYSDYIAKPRPSGYRGVHMVVEYDQRAIEIQLRTQGMHEWAITMEQIGGNIGLFLKTEGDHPVQELMAAVSQAMADQESGRMSDEALLSSIRTLRARASQSLKERHGQG